MPRFHVNVRVMPRQGLLDPQGQAVEHALHALQFDQVGEVRVGKAISLAVEAPDADRAREAATAMCQRLLANPVTEDFNVVLEPVP